VNFTENASSIKQYLSEVSGLCVSSVFEQDYKSSTSWSMVCGVHQVFVNNPMQD